jgi:hypothetical protein
MCIWTFSVVTDYTITCAPEDESSLLSKRRVCVISDVFPVSSTGTSCKTPSSSNTHEEK